MTNKIAVIVGSLRKESYNRKIALELARLAPPSLQLQIVEIGDLPFYNEDLDNATAPATWTRFREQIKAADGVLFLTPEYNRSMSAVIKNAVDVGSRPYGQNAWDGKPAAVLSVSIGAIGGFGANHQLRQALSFINTPCMLQPEAYIGNVASSFDASGKLSAGVETYLQTIISAYAGWVQKIKG